MIVSDYILTMRERLFDPGRGAGWSDDELIDYLNRAQQRVVFLKPDAYTQRLTLALDPGISQTLPDGAVGLFDVLRNTNGGRVVEQVDYDLLKASDWYWPAGTATHVIECYAADPRDPRRFLVSPPASSGTSLKVVVGMVAPTLVHQNDETVLPESYNATLIDGALAQAWGKPSKRQDPAKSSYHQQLFDGALGVATKAQFSFAPKVSQSPGL